MTSHHLTHDRVSFGFWVYLMSDCVLFACLFAAYAVFQGATFAGATLESLVSVPFVLVETMLLLTSSFTAGLALLAARERHRSLTVSLLAVTLLLGVAFLSMEVYEFSSLIAEGAGPSRSAFLSSFFTLIGTHGLHVFFGMLWLMVILAHIAIRGLTPGTLVKITIFSLFWHFLDLIWIFIFTFVYLFGVI